MAYITNFNFRRILQGIRINDEDVGCTRDVFDGLIKNDSFWVDIFNKFEKRSLLFFMECMMDPNIIKNLQSFKGIGQREDTYTYVYEIQQPCYHLNPECEYLHSSYENYYIPKEIREKGSDTVIEYRSWFNENRELFEKKLEKKDFETLEYRIKMKFDVKVEEKELEKAVSRANSGVGVMYNNLDEIKVAIKDMVDKMIDYENQSPRYKTILYHYRKRAYLGTKDEPIEGIKMSYSSDDIKFVLREFEENYKAPLTELLQTYYRIKYNPDLEFEQSVLEKLGFRKCSFCG